MEFKFDPRTGQYKLLDVNPRLWLWHSIGPLAGVDFPYLLWKLILGEAVVTPKGSDDVRWIRMSGDMRAVFQEILAGTFSPVKYLNSLRTPLSFSMFAIDDPLPGLLQLPYKVFRRVWKHEPSKKIEDPLLPAVRIGTRVR
jgi:predicted ATP-grasp superfamily ATP-dependent carboligase